MDPVSILGVAAATIQFVDFGQRLFSETWQIYRSASGQTLRLQNLSAISADISRLSTSVKESFGQKDGTAALDGHDKELLRLCRECDDIATEILAVMPRLGIQFKRKLATDDSVGECFRAALKSWWKRDEITKIGERLEKVRQEIMTAATISIWRNSQSTKNWEHQFSNKIDTMIEMLSYSLETTGRFGPEQHQGHNKKTVEEKTVESLRRNHVTDQIKSRIWQADWKPDAQLLSSFPQETGLSVEDVNSYICESLRFDAIDNREEAITKTFDCTFQWVFDRDPQVSPQGASMWSSFPDWLEGDSGLPYWITGKPGSGKSTMMKFILQNPALKRHLQKWSLGLPVYTIKYYAWRPGVEMAKSEDGLLRTLLHQLLKINPKMVPYLCPRRWSLFHAVREMNALPPWPRWELEESFGRLLELEEDAPLLALFIDGLDEFDAAPVNLCKRIQTISSHNNVKVCIASRPWPQFSDAFTASPRLQMHLLTNVDIQAFVRGHFRGVIAFQELDDLYQGGGQALMADIVTKARGVFLWTALVTQTLLENLIDGSGLPHLRIILDAMPSEIESLYDAIYAAIPERLLPEVSAMLQLYVRAFQPVDLITLWLADEARSEPTDTQTLVQDLDMARVQVTVKRRLGARTRGILELVPQTQKVEYLHRTAAEWAAQPRVWKQIQSASPQGFDPYACLLQAEVIRMKSSDDSAQYFYAYEVDFRKHVTKALNYAAKVNGAIISGPSLAAILDQFDDAATKKLTPIEGWRDVTPYNRNIPWASYHGGGKVGNLKANTFKGLATQFAILPYIAHKFNENPSSFQTLPGDYSVPFLEQAIYGAEECFLCKPGKPVRRPSMPTISKSKRLQVAEFLLQKGVRQPGILSIIKASRLYSRNEQDAQYLDAVVELLHRHGALNMAPRVDEGWHQDPGLGIVEKQVSKYLKTDNHDALSTIIAPSFVGNPEFRGTMTIIWSCIITLIACLYTALHLNVPGDTKALPMLREKFKWVVIGLVAPEVVLYLASSQFLDARRLSQELTLLWRQQHEPNSDSIMLGDLDDSIKKEDPCFDIKYGFFVIMGGLEVDVRKFEHFTAHWAPRGTLQSGTLRLSVNGVLQLARLGHFLPIPRSKINDKSKADTLQKVFVMTQVTWMATQCIVRKAYGVPISLLEIHTMVHVICAIVMFLFWIKKPKDMLDPESVNSTKFEDIIALMVQEQFHSTKSEEYILYPKRRTNGRYFAEEQAALVWVHHTDTTQRKYLRNEHDSIKPIQWVEDDGIRIMLKTGEVLPSGLGVVARSATWETETIQRKILPEWYDEHSYDDPWDIPDSIWVTEWVEVEPVPPTVDLYAEDIQRWNHVIQAIEYLDGKVQQPEPFRHNHQRVRYSDQNFHNAFTRSAGNFQYSEESRIDPDQILTFIINSPILLVLLLVLPGLYGGIHLATSNLTFPTDIERLLWKIASIDIIVTMPIFLVLTFIGVGISSRYFVYESVAHDSWATFYKLPAHVFFFAYSISRIFLVIESFISLRALPIGTYWTPSWLQMLPHV
ncbi:hypothetical protein FSARC_7021 [Fusarium sarcochroum]|uniref:NACHT domain-containing protein n=1 Tax=Fusarium sarcochroum TaxID=1208366 RepID=A0A8H4TWD7_9HYPO|nr:hypothetical protein FSARC_7021 [Fusarium sarcochroum]